MTVTPMGGQGIQLSWRDAIAIADKLRMQVYYDTNPGGLGYDYEYYCYTLPEKALADFAWSIERLQYDSTTHKLLARHYAMSGGETSQIFRFPATDLATVSGLPYQTA